MSQSVVHHVEMCVNDAEDVRLRLQKFGFEVFAEQSTQYCKSLAVKLGQAIFVIRERQFTSTNEQMLSLDPMMTVCCEKEMNHEVDSAFNIAFNVADVDSATDRVVANGGEILRPASFASDSDGTIAFSVVRCSTMCGNVIHTLLNKDKYSGNFLVGFKPVGLKDDKVYEKMNDVKSVSHIDHITIAVRQGDSESVIKIYEACFGMKRFSISRDDDANDGLILEDGVGLRLKALEYFRCAETGLTLSNSSSALLFVVVESLPNQTNCNVETFLADHCKPGVEHLALHCSNIVETVSQLTSRGVTFRRPPPAYYKSIKHFVTNLEHEVTELERCGILIDNETEKGEEAYLMQIFSHPLFNRKTFFIEIICRVGLARGLGTGNIKALVRSIREEEKIKKLTQPIENDSTRHLY